MDRVNTSARLYWHRWREVDIVRGCKPNWLLEFRCTRSVSSCARTGDTRPSITAPFPLHRACTRLYSCRRSCTRRRFCDWRQFRHRWKFRARMCTCTSLVSFLLFLFLDMCAVSSAASLYLLHLHLQSFRGRSTPWEQQPCSGSRRHLPAFFSSFSPSQWLRFLLHFFLPCSFVPPRIGGGHISYSLCPSVSIHTHTHTVPPSRGSLSSLSRFQPLLANVSWAEIRVRVRVRI